jgi:hypothetical protein
MAEESLRLVRALTETVTRLEDLIACDDPHERCAGITDLARLIESVYDDDAAMLGDFMRECGGVDLIIEYIADPSVEVQQRALMVMGNMVSDAVDPHASATKELFVQSGGADVLLPLLEAKDWVTQMYACACCQNLAEDAAFSRVMQKRGTMKVLTRLLKHPQQRVVRFAAGAAKNLQDNIDAEEAAKAAREVPSHHPRPAPRRPAARRAAAVAAHQPAAPDVHPMLPGSSRAPCPRRPQAETASKSRFGRAMSPMKARARTAAPPFRARVPALCCV